LVVLGPERLPAAARALGRFMGQLRSMSSSFQSEVREALQDPNDAFSGVLDEFRPSDFRPGEVRRTVRRAVVDAFTPAPEGAPTATPPNGSSPALPPAGPRPVPDDPTFN
jgi:sec-independent protein translocase protein TatB